MKFVYLSLYEEGEVERMSHPSLPMSKSQAHTNHLLHGPPMRAVMGQVIGSLEQRLKYQHRGSLLIQINTYAVKYDAHRALYMCIGSRIILAPEGDDLLMKLWMIYKLTVRVRKIH